MTIAGSEGCLFVECNGCSTRRDIHCETTYSRVNELLQMYWSIVVKDGVHKHYCWACSSGKSFTALNQGEDT